MRELIVAAGLINLITRLAATVPAYAQEWQINRFQDRMSDMSEHEATLSVPEGSMTVSCVVGRKALLITFGSETYLGATGFQRHRRMQYRIDGNPAVEFRNSTKSGVCLWASPAKSYYQLSHRNEAPSGPPRNMGRK